MVCFLKRYSGSQGIFYCAFWFDALGLLMLILRLSIKQAPLSKLDTCTIRSSAHLSKLIREFDLCRKCTRHYVVS